MLIVFGGLPGSGKTTISRAVALRRAATYLRIDTIEQAIRATGVLAGDIGPAGYDVANRLAEDNLVDGSIVVVDCVNPVDESRRGWRSVAARSGAGLIEVEVVCSDPMEHRRRVEGRIPDIEGLKPPTWTSVMSHDYEIWHEPHLVLDTARLPPEDTIAIVERHIVDMAGIKTAPPPESGGT
jgi:predicted kinase